MIIDTLTIFGFLLAAFAGTFCFILGCVNKPIDRLRFREQRAHSLENERGEINRSGSTERVV